MERSTEIKQAVNEVKENVKLRDRRPLPKDPTKVEPLPAENRMRGIPLFECYQQSTQDVLRVLNYVEVKTEVVGSQMIGTFISKKSRTIIEKSVECLVKTTLSVFHCQIEKFWMASVRKPWSDTIWS